jgi:hypothetical protein
MRASETNGGAGMERAASMSEAAVFGLAIGAAFGLAEATFLWVGGAAGSPWGFFVGPVLDGLLGAVLWMGWRRAGLGSSEGWWGRQAVALLCLGLVLAVVVPERGVSLTSTDRELASRRDLLWVIVEGVEAPIAYEGGGLTALLPLAPRTVRVEHVRAVADDPEVALATLLTGRAPEGHGLKPGGTLDPDVPGFGAVFERAGYATVAVSHEGVTALTGFDHVVRLSPLAFGGSSSMIGGLGLVRAFNALTGPPAAGRIGAEADQVVDAALRVLEQADQRPLALVVHLRDPWAVEAQAPDDPQIRREARAEGLRRADAALGRLVRAWSSGFGDESMVVVSGVSGAVPRSGDAVSWGAEREVPLWVAYPASAGLGAGSSPDLIRTIDVVPSLSAVADESDLAAIFDGEGQLLRIAWDLRQGHGQRLAAAGVDPCDDVHRRLGRLRSFETAWRDGEIAGRAVVGGGYLVNVGEEGEPSRLFNVIEDPAATGLPVRDGAVTCGGLTGRERREAYEGDRRIAETTSAGRREVGLPERVEEGSVAEDLPVPSRYRKNPSPGEIR